MNYIKGRCFTNLDDFDCSLVAVFAAIPQKGDRVAVKYKGNESYLKVVGITHDVTNLAYNPEPYIKVELNK